MRSPDQTTFISTVTALRVLRRIRGTIFAEPDPQRREALFDDGLSIARVVGHVVLQHLTGRATAQAGEGLTALTNKVAAKQQLADEMYRYSIPARRAAGTLFARMEERHAAWLKGDAAPIIRDYAGRTQPYKLKTIESFAAEGRVVAALFSTDLLHACAWATAAGELTQQPPMPVYPVAMEPDRLAIVLPQTLPRDRIVMPYTDAISGAMPGRTQSYVALAKALSDRNYRTENW